MPPGFFKGYFHLPSFDKPFDDLFWRGGRPRAEECLRFKLAERITHYHPANRHGFFRGVIPHAFAAYHLDYPISFAIPILDPQLFPFRLRIGNDRLQGRQPLTFFARASHLSRTARRGFPIKGSVKAQL